MKVSRKKAETEKRDQTFLRKRIRKILSSYSNTFSDLSAKNLQQYFN